MHTLDIIILGMAAEGPRSAYDIQKDVEYHQLSRWTRVSVPSVYRKVLRLSGAGYLRRETVKGERRGDKAVYSITEEGRRYFMELLRAQAVQPVQVIFDFNTVISNLNKVDRGDAAELVNTLREKLREAAEENLEYAGQYREIPLVGREIINQQGMVYGALLRWLDEFEEKFKREIKDERAVQPESSV